MLKDKFDPFQAILEGKELHGRTRITLTDVHTGKVEISEDENMVTNAVADLLGLNGQGLAYYQPVLPLKKLFSGVLLFEGDLSARTAADYYPPSQNDAILTGHAGDEPNNTESTLRGSPNQGETEFTPNSAKFVWTFDTNEANGNIDAVCLCPGKLGNMGLMPYDNAHQPFIQLTPGGASRAWEGNYGEREALEHPLILNPNSMTAMSIYARGNLVDIHEVKLNSGKLNITRSFSDVDKVSVRNLSLTNNMADCDTVVYDDTFFYFVHAATSKLTIEKVARSNLNKTVYEINCNQTLYTGNDNVSHLFHGVPHYPLNNGKLYWPISDRTAFVVFNIDGTGEPSLLPGSKAVASQMMRPINISDDLILGENYIINSGRLYPIQQNEVMPDVVVTNFSSDVIPLQGGQVAQFGCARTATKISYFGPGFHNMIMTTINVLAERKTKTSSKVMKIEYLISE